MPHLEEAMAESLGISLDRLSAIIPISTQRVRDVIIFLFNSSTAVTAPMIQHALKINDTNSIPPILTRLSISGLVQKDDSPRKVSDSKSAKNQGVRYVLGSPWRDFFHDMRHESNTTNDISEIDMAPFSRLAYIFHAFTDAFLSRCFPDLLKGSLSQSQILDKTNPYLSKKRKKDALEKLIQWIAQQYLDAEGILVVDRSEGKEADPLISLNADFKHWYERMIVALRNVPQVTENTSIDDVEPQENFDDTDPNTPLSASLTPEQRVRILGARLQNRIELRLPQDDQYVPDPPTPDTPRDFRVLSETSQERRALSFAIKKAEKH